MADITLRTDRAALLHHLDPEWALAPKDGREPALVHARANYWVPLREIATFRDVMRWATLLAAKSWATALTIVSFIELATEQLPAAAQPPQWS